MDAFLIGFDLDLRIRIQLFDFVALKLLQRILRALLETLVAFDVVEVAFFATTALEFP